MLTQLVPTLASSQPTRFIQVRFELLGIKKQKLSYQKIYFNIQINKFIHKLNSSRYVMSRSEPEIFKQDRPGTAHEN